MTTQNLIQMVKRIIAAFLTVGLICPSPAYTARPLGAERVVGAGGVVTRLASDVSFATMARSEARSIARGVGNEISVSVNEGKGASPLWMVSVADQQPTDIRRIEGKAKEVIGRAFHEARSYFFFLSKISVGKDETGALKLDDTHQKRLDGQVKGWQRFRSRHEDLNEVLPDEAQALREDLVESVAFIKKAVDSIEDNKVRKEMTEDLRFVLIIPEATPNTEQGDLMEQELGIRPPTLYFYGKNVDGKGNPTSLYYGEEQPGFFFDDRRVSVLGLAGEHDYKSFQASEAQPSPHTLYVPLSRVKRYARMLKEAEGLGKGAAVDMLRNAFRDWILQAAGSLGTGKPQELVLEQRENLMAAEKLVAQSFQSEYDAYLTALNKTHQNRLREYKVDVELLRWLTTQNIPIQLQDAVSKVLFEAREKSEIIDFTVTRVGDDLSIWISHKRPTQDSFVPSLAKKAILAALETAKTTGILKPLQGEPDPSGPSTSEEAFYAALRWRPGNVVYTVRLGAEPTIRVKYFGGSRKAFDLGSFDTYSNIGKTTMGAIEGIPGWYYVAQSIDDLREGRSSVKGNIMRYPNDTAGLALSLRDEGYAFTAIFPGKQSKIRMDEPVAMTFLDAAYQDDENLVDHPELRPFSPWFWASQHSGKEAKGSTEGVILEPKIIEGPDRHRAIQPLKLSDAARMTWADIKNDPVASAIGLEVHVTEKGGYDAIDVVSMGGRSTEYQDLQPQYDRMREDLRNQGQFQYQLTNRFAALGAERVWEGIENEAKKARSESRRQQIGDVLIGVPEDLPDRKEGQLPAVWNFVRNYMLFVLTMKKGDIGGIGHGAPHPYYEPVAAASYDEITQRAGNKLSDHLTFAIGDDLQFLTVHEDGPLSDVVGQYAWESFWRAGWAIKALALNPYGFMQDAPGAKNKNPRDEAQLNKEFMAILGDRLRQWAGDPHIQEYLDLNHLDIDQVFNRLNEEFKDPKVVPPQAVGGVVQLAGNLVGSGFGNADLVVTQWLQELTQGLFMFLGFDKASPAVYNSLVVEAALQAVHDGTFENLFFDIQNVHRDRHVLLDVQTSTDKILALTGNSVGFQLSDVFTKDRSGNFHQVASFTTDRLFQVLLALTGKPAYGGKDDPEALIAWVLGKYVMELVTGKRKFYFVLGNERGSNLRLVRWTPVRRPFLGQYSDPTAAAGRFEVNGDGKLVVQPNGEKFIDLLDTPQMAEIRQQVKARQIFYKSVQGSHGPVSAAPLSLLEAAYPAPASRDLFLQDENRFWSVHTNQLVLGQHGLARSESRSAEQGAAETTSSGTRLEARLPDGQARLATAKELAPETKLGIQRTLAKVLAYYQASSPAAKIVHARAQSHPRALGSAETSAAARQVVVAQGLVGADAFLVDPTLLLREKYLVFALALREFFGNHVPIAVPTEDGRTRQILDEVNNFLAGQGREPFLVTASEERAVQVLREKFGARQIKAVVSAHSNFAEVIRRQIPDQQIISETRLQGLFAQHPMLAGLAADLQRYFALAQSA